MKFHAGNAQDIGRRGEQQDAFGFTDPADQSFVRHGGFVAALADGMGGPDAGAVASRTAIRAFLAGYERKAPEESVPEAMRRAVDEANQAVCALGADSGTTFAAAAFLESSFYWISVGDSAIYLARAGSLRQLNRAHTYADLLDGQAEKGEITAQEALRHPERESLTAYLGLEDLREVDCSVQPLALEHGDQVILSTDGLFKTLSSGEIARAITAAPQETCETLVAQALRRNNSKQDNITIVAVRATEERAAAAAPIRPPARSSRGWLIAAALAVVILLGIALAWKFANRGPVLKLAQENVPWVRTNKTGKYTPGAVPEGNKE